MESPEVGLRMQRFETATTIVVCGRLVFMSIFGKQWTAEPL
jgi:hypothetical protein